MAAKINFYIIASALFILLAINAAEAIETDKIQVCDTIESIAKRNFKNVSVKYGARFKEYEDDIKKWNPEITDWKRPPKKQLIYVDYPYNYYVAGSMSAPPLGKDDAFEPEFSLSAFYSFSFGGYKEVTSDQTVQSGQNFPVTLGLGLSLTNEEKKHFLLSSAYWAQSSKGEVGGNSTSPTAEFSIPGEVGFNFYYQYYFKENLLGLYLGYDYEKLTTFNTSEIVSGSPIRTIDNKIQYATFGASKGFSLFNLKMNLKTSFSKSLASTTSGTAALSGSKYIIYYSVIPEGRFSFHALYKHHELSGPTKLSIDRIGLSVGILVF